MKNAWLALFGAEYLKDTDPGNMLKHMRPLSWTHPQGGCEKW
jgi:hypothetical protein